MRNRDAEKTAKQVHVEHPQTHGFGVFSCCYVLLTALVKIVRRLIPLALSLICHQMIGLLDVINMTSKYHKVAARRSQITQSARHSTAR